MLYIVYSLTSAERLVCTSVEEAERTAIHRTRVLGYVWRIMPVAVPAEVAA